MQNVRQRKTNIIRFHFCVESYNKGINKTKRTHRYGEQTASYERRRGLGDEQNVWRWGSMIRLQMIIDFCGDHFVVYTAAAAKSLQSCPTLCDPIDSSLPGSPVPGTLQTRTLEWVAISCSNAWKWKNKVKSLSRVRLLATPRTAAHQGCTLSTINKY